MRKVQLDAIAHLDTIVNQVHDLMDLQTKKLRTLQQMRQAIIQDKTSNDAMVEVKVYLQLVAEGVSKS